MKLTRREAVAAGVALSACGRSELFDEDDGLAASDPGDDDVGLIQREVEEPTSPIHLTASTILASNTTGGVNAVALKNPLGGPMEIHEVKWAITASSIAGGAETFGNVFGGIIACKLDLGTVKLTNGFVPVWNFGRADDLFLENHADAPVTLGLPFNTTAFYTWKFARPLYIPEDSILTPTFQHRGLLSKDLQVNINYAGRSLASKKPPRKVYVPYASSYSSKVFDFTAGAAVDSDQSTETDLVNPWGEPLHLQRFTGRYYTRQQAPGVDSLFEDQLPSVSNPGTTVRIVDSNGRPIVQNPTAFRQVFAAATRSWEMDGHVMDPYSHYRAFLRADPTGFVLAGSIQAQAQIGVVGWRELDRSKP